MLKHHACHAAVSVDGLIHLFYELFMTGKCSRGHFALSGDIRFHLGDLRVVERTFHDRFALFYPVFDALYLGFDAFFFIKNTPCAQKYL